jgi:DNA integrity scanning protein DisA with diadenylate cyclase activity
MLEFTVLDIIDIFMVAIIFYQLYRLIRGTAAFSIFLGIFFVYLFWLVVKALNMELISAIIGQVIGVGSHCAYYSVSAGDTPVSSCHRQQVYEPQQVLL